MNLTSQEFTHLLTYEDGRKYIFARSEKQQAEEKTLPLRPFLTFRSGKVKEDGKKLSAREVRTRMSNDHGALRLYNHGRNLHIIGMGIAMPGSFMFGYDLGTRLGGGEGDNAMLITSGGLIVIGLILTNSSVNNIKNALNLYNSRVPTEQESLDLSFGFTQSGVGFTLRF